MYRSSFVILILALIFGLFMPATPAPAQTVSCAGVAAWSANSVSYAVGALVTYEGSEYKCLQAHTSEVGWDPVDAPALWSLVGTCSTSTTSSTTGATCSAVPSAPSGLSASSTTQTGTTLSWNAVTPPSNCSITSYTIYKSGTSIGTSTGTSFAVTGLSAGTSYTFTVAATDSDGTGSQSSSVSVTTSSASCSAVPSAPGGLAASSTTSSGTTLSWSAVTPPSNCSIASYTIYKSGTSIGTSTSTSFAVTGLSASTTYSFTVAATDSDGTGSQSSSVSVTTSAATSGEAPYGGTAAAIPGTVQAENYDTGGQGVAYNVTSINGSDNGYRSDGVDLETTTDTGGGVDLGWTAAGQWFRYTVKVATAGTYTASFRVAADSATGTTAGTCYIENSSGTNLTGNVSIPGTGGWQTWTTINANLTLPAGQQVLTVYQNSGGYNINYISFASASSSCSATPSAPSGLAASGTTSSGTNLSWNSVGAPANCSISGYTVYENGTAIATVSSGTSYSVSGLAASTTYSFTVAAVDSDGIGTKSSSLSVTTGAPSTVTTTGSITFHLSLGVTTSNEDIVLTGDNFTDLIMSNMISGVLYSHMVGEFYPGIQFNRDYLVGSNFGELLQENLATEYYVDSSNLIDSNPNQQAVMGVGQGGPYQINNYAVDMVGGTTTPAGHSMINYIAIQNNIGYTMSTAANQSTQVTPPSFNNKYYGPILPAYFHYNDMVSLELIGTGPDGWTTPWQPEYDNCLANFVNLPNSFLDMLLNAAYNQGYYGGLVASYSTTGETATAATVATVDAYTSVWGNTSSYNQYPYQVHYYLDQLYDNPIPTTSATTFTTPTNHVAFNMTTLEGVFTNVFETLDYSNGTAAAQYFTAAQAQAAYTSALSTNGVSASSTLDLSNASQRAQIFAVLNSAIGNLETTSGMKFNATTLNQL